MCDPSDRAEACRSACVARGSQQACVEERRRFLPQHAARPETRGVPAGRVDGPVGERPEGARGEDAG